MQVDNQNNINDLSLVDKAKHWYRQLPDKKRYLEFITAFLSIPVLLTVVISNVRSLQSQNAAPTPTPAPTTSVISPTLGLKPSDVPIAIDTPSTTPTPGPQCNNEIGPIEIVYPEEGQVVSSDPVCLDIVREGTNYCSVVWSYRINGSSWSDYTDRSICMYGLSPGQKNLELRIKSIVTGTETILRRTFAIPTPTPTLTQTPVPTP